jgi:hypothetical protein
MQLAEGPRAFDCLKRRCFGRELVGLHWALVRSQSDQRTWHGAEGVWRTQRVFVGWSSDRQGEWSYHDERRHQSRCLSWRG